MSNPFGSIFNREARELTAEIDGATEVADEHPTEFSELAETAKRIDGENATDFRGEAIGRSTTQLVELDEGERVLHDDFVQSPQVVSAELARERNLAAAGGDEIVTLNVPAELLETSAETQSHLGQPREQMSPLPTEQPLDQPLPQADVALAEQPEVNRQGAIDRGYVKDAANLAEGVKGAVEHWSAGKSDRIVDLLSIFEQGRDRMESIEREVA